MPKKQSTKHRRDYKETKEIGRSDVHSFFKVILWPFKWAYKIASWIAQGIIVGIEKMISLFSRNQESSSGSGSRQSIFASNKSEYVQFNTIKSIKGDYEDFEDFLAKKDSTIGIILGARGSGKSAIGLKILENIHTKSPRKMFALGFKAKDLPAWITPAQELEQIENNSYVLIDEGGILFSSRKGFSDANTLLSKLLLIARHKDLSILFISQNSANLEVNAIRQTDYLILKPSSLLQLDFERKKIKEIYEDVKTDFERLKDMPGLTYIYSDKFRGFVTNPLPSFWTTNLSKSFKDARHEK